MSSPEIQILHGDKSQLGKIRPDGTLALLLHVRWQASSSGEMLWHDCGSGGGEAAYYQHLEPGSDLFGIEIHLRMIATSAPRQRSRVINH